MSNQEKEKQDLQKLSMYPFVRFTEEDRKKADEFLELQTVAEKGQKKVEEKQKNVPLLKKETEGAKSKSSLKNAEDSEKPVFICDYCQKVFSKPSQLKLHVPVHTGQKDYHCHLCDYSAAQKAHLEEHIRRHLKEKNFKCLEPNCGADFVSSSELKRHESIHNKFKKFTCSACPYKSNSKSHVTRHMKNIHSELKPFKCPQENCEYSAKMKSSLNQHLKIHSLEKDQICPHADCEFKTKWSKNLKSHMKTHSTGEKRYKCHFCEYSSHQHASLVLHIRQHTLETPFSCNLCSFKSKDKSSLKYHMKTHAD